MLDLQLLFPLTFLGMKHILQERRRYKEEDVISHINAVFVEYDYESRRPLRSLVASEPFLQQQVEEDDQGEKEQQ